MKLKWFIRAASVACITLAFGDPARADVITDWNDAALQAIRKSNTPPPAASRNLATLHTAMYDAVNGISEAYRPYFVTTPAPEGASKEAAASAAALRVLKTYYPQAELVATATALHEKILATLPGGETVADGVTWGDYVGQMMVELRTGDGSEKTVAFPGSTEVGKWRPTVSFGGIVRPALLPQWGGVTPFALSSGSQFRPPAPPSLRSATYTSDFNEVRYLGEANSRIRSADQTQIAKFWAYGPGTATPPGHWNQVARAVSGKNSLDENARMFALLNIAMADAAIVSWDAKYVYNLWRPITAIAEADRDNNPNTVASKIWKPLLETPPFPEYTSGHSTFSGAAAAVLASFFGTDRISFSLGSDDLPGVKRYYRSFSQAAEESGKSRIYGGIHFQSANRYGLSTGREVGMLVSERLMKPNRQPDVIITWNNAALDAIRQTRMSPPRAARALAVMHTAIFDAVNGISRQYQPYLVPANGPSGASRRAAAIHAAQRVMLKEFPTQTNLINQVYNETLARIPNNSARRLGALWGRSVGDAIVRSRNNDGSTNVVPYTQQPAPGIWRPTPSFGGAVLPALLPGWGNVRPFALTQGSQFRPPAPPALHSQQYADEVFETQIVGRKSTHYRSEEQTEIAFFWSNGAGTSTPPGHWNEIAQIAALNRGNNLLENARLFALLNVSLADAAISCWDAKYVYNLWRPITAITLADQDNNPNTVPEPDWVPLLDTPPFPEYTSGHSTFSGAGAAALSEFFGNDRVGFTVGSDGLPGVYRGFKGFRAAAEESGLSRIYGGIHFQSANRYGLSSGAQIGEYASEHLMQPYSRSTCYSYGTGSYKSSSSTTSSYSSAMSTMPSRVTGSTAVEEED